MFRPRIAFIVTVEDYHDIGYIARSIQGIDLSHAELGTMQSGMTYVGVIFSHYKPEDEEIQEMLLEAKIELNSEGL